MSSKYRAALLGLVLAVFAAGTSVRVASPRFLPDDPLQVDDDRALDASGVAPIEVAVLELREQLVDSLKRPLIAGAMLRP